MKKEKIAFFKSYPFIVGQKINIENGPRKGDWEVVGLTERKVKLRCPISCREVEWNRFCYFSEKRYVEKWPNGESEQ